MLEGVFVISVVGGTRGPGQIPERTMSLCYKALVGVNYLVNYAAYTGCAHVVY